MIAKGIQDCKCPIIEKNIYLRSGINEKSDAERIVPFAYLFCTHMQIRSKLKFFVQKVQNRVIDHQ